MRNVRRFSPAIIFNANFTTIVLLRRIRLTASGVLYFIQKWKDTESILIENILQERNYSWGIILIIWISILIPIAY